MNTNIKNLNPVQVYSQKKDGSMMQKKMIVTNNVKKFLHDHNIPFEKFYYMNQVHGSNIQYVTENASPTIADADGLITDNKNVFLGIYTADCVPLLFSDEEAGVVGAVHAGFRGMLSGIIPQFMAAAKKLGSEPNHMKVSIGPAISACCYNVEGNRAQQFVELFGESVIRYSGDQIFLDLHHVAIVSLEESGIRPENIMNSKICTSCRNDTYFSYRRDSESSFGEFLSVIGIKS